MNDYIFAFLVIALSLILVLLATLVIKEVISSRKHNDRFRPPLKYLRSYKDGYTFSDNADLSQAIQVIYITSDFIEYSDMGINGRFDRIWTR